MKISLIQCPVWGTYDPPLALAQLSACLKKSGHQVHALDLNIELYLNRKENHKGLWAWEKSDFWYDPANVAKFFVDNEELVDQYLKQIIAFDPQVICFSVCTSSRLASLELAKKIKKTRPGQVIVFGGTLFFEESWSQRILLEGVVDIVAIGEGEITLCELVSFIQENKPLDSCLGISYQIGAQIFHNSPRPLLEDLDELPFMDFSDLPLDKYDDKCHIPILASRGCVQQCVFCSSKAFWPGYRHMSGKRIFEEIKFHKQRVPELGHIDFLDLLINGDIKALNSLCDLMIDWGLSQDITISWVANAIIRKEMTAELLRKMKKAGCKHLIYGIESGSQRVLGLMKKRYALEDADNVIRATHEAGIVATANFMFGFPGEEEEDFQKTLDFLKRNAGYLDRAYPSRTFCAIEEYSYLHAHQPEFGILANSPNHLYWESQDGRNVYPERLRRCEEFCALASSLGIEVASGVQTAVDLDRWFNLAHYYEYKKDLNRALENYLNYYEREPQDRLITEKLSGYYDYLKDQVNQLQVNPDILCRLKKAADAISAVKGSFSTVINSFGRGGRGKSLALARAEQRDNLALNDDEYNDKRINLKSTPKAFFLQVSGPCNASCAFCSRGNDYEMFNLDVFREKFEEKLFYTPQRAQQIVLTGSGEYLLLPQAGQILDYFDTAFPHVEKMFSTNGSGLTAEICHKIASGKSRYTIHASLHASYRQLHQVMTRLDNFHKILGQLKYLLELRKQTQNVGINLIFVATTLNIEDLPNFIFLAANLGVDKVICYYNYIYVPAQKYLSCFFKQELTNQKFDEAEKIAARLNIGLQLPPRFNQKEYPVYNMCREPWSQVMFDMNGHILPCDAAEDCYESLEKAPWFGDIWNGQYYRKLRQSLVDGSSNCFKYCFRANPSCVNDFRSHVIRRGRKDSDVDIFWADNF
ncbi:MAG: radical SAM protein [Candidatus Omnitrophica bacterium]|nr:radical SAM protein [Candidatus Omnitrophota bacterium]